MEGVGYVEWHGHDYLHLKWHVVCSGLATPALGAKYSSAPILINVALIFVNTLYKVTAIVELDVDGFLIIWPLATRRPDSVPVARDLKLLAGKAW